MDHFKSIYNTKNEAYHQLILAEDYQNHLCDFIKTVVNPQNKSIIDLGSGTGRFPLLLKSFNCNLTALEYSFHMLHFQQSFIKQEAQTVWQLLNGDIRSIPISNDSFDIALCGWVIGHFIDWNKENWKTTVDKIIDELFRVTKKNGSIYIFETMSTGSIQPTPPTQGLADYYDYLENKWGFSKTIISTDYQFESVNEAEEKLTFFFGPELRESIHKNQWQIVPEWTGIWQITKS